MISCSCSCCSGATAAAPPAQHKLLEGALARRARVVAALLLLVRKEREGSSFFSKKRGERKKRKTKKERQKEDKKATLKTHLFPSLLGPGGSPCSPRGVLRRGSRGGGGGVIGRGRRRGHRWNGFVDCRFFVDAGRHRLALRLPAPQFARWIRLEYKRGREGLAATL